MIKLHIIKKNREKLLNWSKEYYENNNNRIRDQARNKYRELSDAKKNIKREYGRNRYQTMSKEDKERLKEYEKKSSWNKKIIILNCNYNLTMYVIMYY